MWSLHCSVGSKYQNWVKPANENDTTVFQPALAIFVCSVLRESLNGLWMVCGCAIKG